MPEQLDTTPPPGHGRSRLTDQNASRAMWFALAQSRICVQMDGEVSSCWSDRPFIPEMPMWAYAVASDQPNALLSTLRSPLVALTVLPNMSDPPPKSNGMMVNTSMLAPSAAAWLTSRVPQKFGPYALITCWYAPASALALLQFGPSLLPDQPPKEISTSPPPDRIALIVLWSTPPVNGRLPSHAGVQPPPESMNAIVNCLIPVADITVETDGGSPQPSYRYGAAILPPVGQPPVRPVTLPLLGDSPTELNAATVYVWLEHDASEPIVAEVPLTVARTVEPSYTR